MQEITRDTEIEELKKELDQPMTREQHKYFTVTLKYSEVLYFIKEV